MGLPLYDLAFWRIGSVMPREEESGYADLLIWICTVPACFSLINFGLGELRRT